MKWSQICRAASLHKCHATPFCSLLHSCLGKSCLPVSFTEAFPPVAKQHQCYVQKTNLQAKTEYNRAVFQCDETCRKIFHVWKLALKSEEIHNLNDRSTKGRFHNIDIKCHSHLEIYISEDARTDRLVGILGHNKNSNIQFKSINLCEPNPYISYMKLKCNDFHLIIFKIR